MQREVGGKNCRPKVKVGGRTMSCRSRTDEPAQLPPLSFENPDSSLWVKGNEPPPSRNPPGDG